MDQTLSNAYAMATSSNPIRTNNLSRYQFLYDSYVGGEDYRNGGYLTRYQLETAQDYQLRLQTTPLDNHCRSIIATYISFLFRQEPERDLGSLTTEVTVASFLEDADREGRNLNAVMKQASIWSNVFGHCWLLLSKPDVGAATMADEMALDVRPYLNVLTPLTVTDWTWTRMPNGSYQLTFFKYIEDVNGDVVTIKEWHADKIVTHIADTKKEVLISTLEEVNGLGRIPAVILYAHTSNIRGVGLSTISDLADAQRMIYNMTSEVEQAVRLGSHPSLVKTEAVDAGSGAGSIIQMPENMDPALKPYVLEFSGQPIDSIYVSIKNITDSIDKMANTGSIRATETREMSGVSREVEFQLLNARLSEQADNIELAEEQLWELYAAYQGQRWDGEINYPDSFSVRDTANELDQLIKAKTGVDNPQAKIMIEQQILELLDIESMDPTEQMDANGCPIVMTDKALNIANHLLCVEQANLGPASVSQPGTYWLQRADRLGITEPVSRNQLCKNCGYYTNTPAIQKCYKDNMAAGNIPLATEVNPAWENVPNPAGYCERWDITCTPTRSCDTWISGGPITN